jgi:hypothetical protein
MKHITSYGIFAAAAAILSTSVGHAAITVSYSQAAAFLGTSFGSVTYTDNTFDDLTALGTSDWTYYTGTSPSTVTELNSKSGGAGLGTVTFANTNRNGTLQTGSGAPNVNTTFDFTDGGTVPSSASDFNGAGARALRGGSLTFFDDPGPTFNLTAAVGVDASTLYLWISGHKTILPTAFNITAFDGATQVGSVYTFGYVNAGDAPAGYIQKIEYGGDTTTSGNLNFRIQMTGGSQDDSAITLHAAALSVVP